MTDRLDCGFWWKESSEVVGMMFISLVDMPFSCKVSGNNRRTNDLEGFEGGIDISRRIARRCIYIENFY